jgi:hypothetical protein
MNRDDVIRWAQQSGFEEISIGDTSVAWVSSPERLIDFVDWVADADTALLKHCLRAIEEVYKTGDTEVFDLCHAQFLIPLLHKRLGVGSESTNDS